MGMQTKIMSVIKSKVQKAGLDLVESRAWANTGRVYIQPKDGFESLFGFSYGFYDGWGTIQFYGAGVKPEATCGFTAPGCIKAFHYLDYSNAAQINELMGFVDSMLTHKG